MQSWEIIYSLIHYSILYNIVFKVKTEWLKLLLYVNELIVLILYYADVSRAFDFARTRVKWAIKISCPLGKISIDLVCSGSTCPARRFSSFANAVFHLGSEFLDVISCLSYVCILKSQMDYRRVSSRIHIHTFKAKLIYIYRWWKVKILRVYTYTWINKLVEQQKLF